MKNSSLIGNQVFPTISAEEIINVYGIDETGKVFEHPEFGTVCVVITQNSESGLALGKIDKEDPCSNTLQVVAVITLKEELQ